MGRYHVSSTILWGSITNCASNSHRAH
uniref:Uncharacterized protein n=1 Tax=Arundo donax TaxID=35708 RepID=A0A0A9BBC7_ARUDO